MKSNNRKLLQVLSACFFAGVALPASAEPMNIALNPSRSGVPHPLESDDGWGGGEDKWDLVDGIAQYASFSEGLAFTGGDGPFGGESAGPRQATIDFGQPKTFNQVVLWHHGGDDVPATTNLEYWDGFQWADIAFTRVFDEDFAHHPVNGWSRPDTYTFVDAITGSKVRYSFDNSGLALNGNPMRHGWIYEFQVFSMPEPATFGLAFIMLIGLVVTRCSCRRSNIGKSRPLVIVAASVVIIFVYASDSAADVFDGIEFPLGKVSFADAVLRYDPLYSGGPRPSELAAVNPTDGLGIPDFPPGGGIGDPGTVALGNGGLIEFLFIDNVLVNSGDDSDDVLISEVGGQVEDTFVAVRPTSATRELLDPALDSNSDGFFEVGKVTGSVSTLDIDASFPGFSRGLLQFDAIQLVDDINEGLRAGSTVGADIDAVGAITQVPEPFMLTMILAAVICKSPRRAPLRLSF